MRINHEIFAGDYLQLVLAREDPLVKMEIMELSPYKTTSGYPQFRSLNESYLKRYLLKSSYLSFFTIYKHFRKFKSNFFTVKFMGWFRPLEIYV